MIKIILLVFIVILCTTIGYLYGEEFRKRYLELNQIMVNLIDMENEIVYSYQTLPELIADIANKSDGAVSDMFTEVAEMLLRGEIDDVNSAFDISMKKYKDKLSVKKEDLDILLDLSKSLGETDVIGQGQIFKLAKEKISRRIQEAELDYKKNCKVYKTLGVGIGFMIAIFLV
ncbi:stage III sporulation protein SpoIIIAB [Clostridium mediterraneense]|uniref:stage III sporulation protein SpoIIIAB n=1 Tax=Clostridium mediterraneense TaxID=1805472 RepID=UPI00082FCBFE|nr:stage III sporulation protein SpoIIIAB [Clostridium mediterraneense]